VVATIIFLCFVYALVHIAPHNLATSALSRGEKFAGMRQIGDWLGLGAGVDAMLHTNTANGTLNMS
jgi:hypothetical protein